MGSLVGKPGNWTVDKIPNLSGKIIIITGANSGTGFEAARAFAMKNAKTILACRSLERGRKACDQIQNEIPYADLGLIQLDLADMTSIKKFANDFINKYDHLDILINNAGIIRNKLKIRATISNAQAFINIQKEFGSFSKYIWGFVNHKPINNKWKSMEEIPATTEISDKLSKDLKKRGFKFVGSTVVYAHMQATGMVNDHVTGCFRHQEV